MKPGQLIPLAGRVSLLVGEGQGRYPRCHCLVIEDQETVLVDAGAGPEVLAPWARPGRVDLLLNTHTHADHAAHNWLFAHTPLWVPVQAWDSAGDLERLSLRFTQPGPLAPAWRERAEQVMGIRDRRPDQSFAPEQEMRAGRTRWQVVHTPGHTADHCCFHFPDLGLVLAADIDLTPFGPWYGHHESSLPQLRASIRAVKELNPRILVSSHMPPRERDIGQALDAWAAVLDQRNQRILDLLRVRPRTLEELVDAALIYGSHSFFPQLFRFWEGQMVAKHLEELMERGLVRPGSGGFEAA